MNPAKKTITIEGVPLERYFAPYEEEALKLIEPHFYLSTGIQDTTYAYHTLQKSFHVLLRKFLKIRKEDFAVVARKEIASCRYLIQLLGGEVTANDPASLVCAVYASLKSLKPEFGTAEKTIKEFDIPNNLESNAAAHSSRHYAQIRELKDWIGKNLSEYVSLFIVHGSFATGDFYEGWSDLDTAVILKDDVFSNPEMLSEAREKLSRAGLVCYLVDPLAHHELMVFTAFDQDYYHEDTLPLSSFENGMLLFGDAHIRFVRRDSHDERLHRLAWYAAWYREKIASGKYADNLYDWKNDAGTAMLIPALAVEAKGEYPYKRESYARAKEIYPDIDWSIVDEVSDLREGWGARSWAQHIPVSWVLGMRYDTARRILMRLLCLALRKRSREDKETVKRVTDKTLELIENVLKANV